MALAGSFCSDQHQALAGHHLMQQRAKKFWALEEWAGAAPEVIASGGHTCTAGAVCTGVGSFGVWHQENALGYTDLSRCRKEDLAETARSQTGSDLSRVRKLPPGNRQNDEAPDPQSFAARPRPSPLQGTAALPSSELQPG